MSKLLILEGATLTMTSQEIADLVESRHDSVKRAIERLANQGVIASPPLVEKVGTGGRPGSEYHFMGEKGKRDSIIIVAQLSPEFTARLVDRWQALEAQVAKSAHAIPQTFAEALRLAADLDEQRRLAVEERDQAIATKAQIGSRREATAMATAAKASREVAKLKDQLGFSKHHATILQVEDATGNQYDFLPLRRWCKANSVMAVTVPDKRYPGGVKAWPAGAWRDCYGVELVSLFH